MRATKLNKTLMARRFIDDIIIKSENEAVSTAIIENLKNTFKEHNLNLTSAIMPTENKTNTIPRC